MRPVKYPGSHVTLPPRLCGNIGYYLTAWQHENYTADWHRRFDKRAKETHRFVIADTRGELSLTVPIAKPTSSSCQWDEIEISTHGNWWDVHRVALESAYGRTPYFEFYIDRFMPMLTTGVEVRYPTLASLARAWDMEIRKILGLSLPSDEDHVSAETISQPAEPEKWTEYYQVRADKLGFIPNLSILDLIFNLGPEAAVYLHSASNQM